MDGLDLITSAIGHGVVSSARIRINGKPHNWSKAINFSDWIHGFAGTDPTTIEGVIRFDKHTGGGGVTISQGIATPIAPPGRPPIATDRLSCSTPLDPEVKAWVKSQVAIAAFVRGLIDRAYREAQEMTKK
jgi:hypothetical protein